MKILHMTLKKKWFDLIACGKKTVEYREDKPYWRKRLTEPDGMPRDFDEIHFRNGYSPKSPSMRVEYLPNITIINGPAMTQHGEILGHNTLALKLGKVIEVRS
jgi:hypothetical protein